MGQSWVRQRHVSLNGTWPDAEDTLRDESAMERKAASWRIPLLKPLDSRRLGTPNLWESSKKRICFNLT